MKQIIAANELSMNKSLQSTLAPITEAIQSLRENTIQKADLLSFKQEWRKEMEDAFAAEAKKNKTADEQEDPFTTNDPWCQGGGAWGHWNAYQSAQAGAANQSYVDQGGTSQIPGGKWKIDGEKAKGFAGAAAERFHQTQQQTSAASSSWIPSQVFVRGWSNWGETHGITKIRANEIMAEIKKDLEVEVQRLIINVTMFDPIQRIAVHVMETPGAAAHVRDKIQQVISNKGLQQSSKDLQVVIQKPPEDRRMNGELNDKQKDIREFFSAPQEDIRPVWSDHCVKGPGGAVLGRFDTRGAWKWSAKNIGTALKVSDAKVGELMALQSLDW
jgi:hypothetical protein